MHTTETLIPEHFRCVRPGHEPDRPGDLSALVPGFGESDRLGVVSPSPLEGIRDAGYAVLACVTAFYDMHRGELSSSRLYPRYYALHAAGQSGADAWGELDIWPASQWIETDGTPGAMLSRALALGVTRLLWPARLARNDRALPAGLRAAGRAQLRSVLVYGGDVPGCRLEGAEPVEDLVRKALASAHAPRHRTGAVPHAEGYRVLGPGEFLPG